MHHNEYQFQAPIWEYHGAGAWFFITLPEDMGKEIKQLFGVPRHGWGSVPVMVTIGNSEWKTSIFPDKESNSYLLPVKAVIRKAEKITMGDTVSALIRILV